MNSDQPIYKYMKKRHAKNFMKLGLIRIGTLYDFREEESHGSTIGDKDEGTKTLTTDGYHFIDTNNPDTIPDWYRKHFNNSFKLEDGARLQIHARDGVRARLTVPDRYVFCASSEIITEFKNEDYDSCLKIYDLEGFFSALTIKLRHKARWLSYGKCIYRPRVVLGDADHGIEPSFIKEERYSYQKEVRALWSPVSVTIEPIILKAKKARQFCELTSA